MAFGAAFVPTLATRAATWRYCVLAVGKRCEYTVYSKLTVLSVNFSLVLNYVNIINLPCKTPILDLARYSLGLHIDESVLSMKQIAVLTQAADAICSIKLPLDNAHNKGALCCYCSF